MKTLNPSKKCFEISMKCSIKSNRKEYKFCTYKIIYSIIKWFEYYFVTKLKVNWMKNQWILVRVRLFRLFGQMSKSKNDLLITKHVCKYSHTLRFLGEKNNRKYNSPHYFFSSRHLHFKTNKYIFIKKKKNFIIIFSLMFLPLEPFSHTRNSLTNCWIIKLKTLVKNK